METITISKQEYHDLKKKALLAELDKFGDSDIAHGLKDLLNGKIRKVKTKNLQRTSS